MAKLRKNKPIPVPIPGVQEKRLSINHIGQERDKWCWAACAQMMVLYFTNKAVSQSDFANWAFSRSDCDSATEECNQGLPLIRVEELYENWKINVDHRTSALTYSDTQDEINAERPLQVVFNWTSGSWHLVILVGWLVQAGEQKVIVNDPYHNGVGLHSYSSVLEGYGLGKWTDTYLGFRKSA